MGSEQDQAHRLGREGARSARDRNRIVWIRRQRRHARSRPYASAAGSGEPGAWRKAVLPARRVPAVILLTQSASHGHSYGHRAGGTRHEWEYVGVLVE
ncbi:hypothetical protein GCM10017687_84030 [Streptomyces echinatus]